MVRREAKGAKVDIPGLPSPKLGAGGNFYSLSSLHSVKLPHETSVSWAVKWAH